MADRKICLSRDLVDGGRGVRFEVRDRDQTAVPAFAIRQHGRVHAYLNRCAHVGVELDLADGRFFDKDGRFLICAMHGALYDPASGACVAGPCNGTGLEPLPTCERNGIVHLVDNDLYLPLDPIQGHRK